MNTKGYNLSFLNLDDIYFCDNIREDILLFKKQYNNNGIGAMILDSNNKISVLINIQDDEYYNIVTIIHELIHAYDVYNFSLHYNIDICNVETFDKDKYLTYMIWSEFHAFFISELFVIEYLKMTSNIDVTKIYLDNQNQILENHADNFYNKSLNHNITIYDFVSFFSKLYLYDYLNDTINSDQSVFQYYKNQFFYNALADSVEKLYQILICSLDDKKIFENLSQLKATIHNIH